MLYSCMEVGLESDGRDRVCWVSSQVGGGRGVVGLGYMQTAMLKRQLTLEELLEGGLVSYISRGGGPRGPFNTERVEDSRVFVYIQLFKVLPCEGDELGIFNKGPFLIAIMPPFDVKGVARR